MPSHRRPMPESPAPEPSGAAAETPAPLTGPLLPVGQAELASALAYGLRFDERGRPRRGVAWEMAATLLAEQGVVRNRVTRDAGLALTVSVPARAWMARTLRPLSG